MLYIEDEENNIALVKALLRRRPTIELHVAMNGRDGVQIAVDKRPGLILLDNRLPRRDRRRNPARTRLYAGHRGDPRGCPQRRLRRDHR